MAQLKYKQLVSATIQRIEGDQNNKYYFVRNETKIMFGDGKVLLGSVIMTNPGSFGFQKDKGWEDFIEGKGSDIFYKNDGHPDPTMINVIRVIEEAYKKANKGQIDGYVNIYNLSSARCADGKQAENCHKSIQKLISNNKLSRDILEDPVLDNKVNFIYMTNKSGFVIIGFLKGVFSEKIKDIENWIEKDKVKNIVRAAGTKNWAMHPIIWMKVKVKGIQLCEKAIGELYEVIK